MNRKHQIIPVVSLTLTATVPATASQPTGSVTLSWTAPGDDGQFGRAAAYDLRYSWAVITEMNFVMATRANGLPVPALPGSPETVTIAGISPDIMRYFALRTRDDVGNWSPISNVATMPGWVDVVAGTPAVASFSTPWPNPARERASFSYTLPREAMVFVQAFDVSGRHVRTLMSGRTTAGSGEWSWDLRDKNGRAVDAGVYLVKARFGDQSWTRKLVVSR